MALAYRIEALLAKRLWQKAYLLSICMARRSIPTWARIGRASAAGPSAGSAWFFQSRCMAFAAAGIFCFQHLRILRLCRHRPARSGKRPAASAQEKPAVCAVRDRISLVTGVVFGAILLPGMMGLASFS